MKPNFGAAKAAVSNAQLNSGSLVESAQQNRIVYLNPNTQVLYDAEGNIRAQEALATTKQELIALRRGIDRNGQLQAIRVYPLPDSKKNPAEPQLAYGIAYGHRRVLALRLNSKDDPAISDTPVTVMAIIDTKWLSRCQSERDIIQYSENSHRLGLDPVEEGMALLRIQQSKTAEQGGSKFTQVQVAELVNKPHKVVNTLMRLAAAHDIVKTACHKRLIIDPDTLATFDSIAKVNEDIALTILAAIEDGAPTTRTLFRKLAAALDADAQAFDAKSFVWPETLEPLMTKSEAPTQVQPNVIDPAPVPAPAAIVDAPARVAQPDTVVAGNADEVSPKAAVKPATDEVAPVTLVGTSTDAVLEVAEVSAPAPMKQAGPVILVRFRMDKEASVYFNGELILSKKAKASANGIVAYVGDSGVEEEVEVPCSLIELLSVNHLG